MCDTDKVKYVHHAADAWSSSTKRRSDCPPDVAGCIDFGIFS